MALCASRAEKTNRFPWKEIMFRLHLRRPHKADQSPVCCVQQGEEEEEEVVEKEEEEEEEERIWAATHTHTHTHTDTDRHRHTLGQCQTRRAKHEQRCSISGAH